MKSFRILLVLPLAGLLSGCDAVLLSPSGDVAVQQRNLILASTVLMLLIILPVMAATLIFAWRYRASNTQAKYDPDWHHSTQLEVLIWTAPLMIIIALGALTWISSHLLDPFRPLDRIDAANSIKPDTPPLEIEVVALDWKWLFFYPDQGIASVNELAAPVNVPIRFRITSATVMNSFFVPALAGQIYAMAGMETKLNAVMNKEGEYDGFSANYSGAGFSHMNFKFHAMAQNEFDRWAANIKGEGSALGRSEYMALSRPSEQEPVHHYAWVERGLYNQILNLCAEPGKMCMSQMMHLDALGGGGKDSEGNRERLKYDGAGLKQGNEAPGATFPASGRPPNTNVQPQGMKPTTLSPDVNQQKTEPDQGQGHDMPGMQNMPGMQHDGPAPAQTNDH